MKRTVSDVMTRTVVSVNGFAPFKDIVRRMQDYRVSAVPVLGPNGSGKTTFGELEEGPRGRHHDFLPAGICSLPRRTWWRAER